MNRTLKNIIYNGVYQLLVIALPVITVPYVARILGAKSLGINSYVVSIGNILGYVIMMGLNQYGVRTIARSDRNTKSLKKEFLNLWILQLIVGIIVVICYSLFSFYNKDRLYFLANLPYLIGFTIDISWFFIGIEKIKDVVIRNTFVKFVTVFFIFVLVHSPNDLYIYILINSCSILFSNIIFWKKLHSCIGGFKFNLKKINLKYFIPVIILGAPQIAVQLYTNFDSTLVGMIAGPTQLSYYDQSQKVVRILLALVTSVSTVLMPKLAQLDKNDNGNYNKILKLSLDITFISSLFITLNLMVNSNDFVPWFFGTKFGAMTDNMFYVSLILIFISYGGVFANQFALSKGYYKEYALPYFLGAIISIPLNIVLVGKYKADGGTATIIVTELMVCLVRIIIVAKKINLKSMFRGQFKYVFVMIICLGIWYEFKFSFCNHLLNIIANTLVYSGMFIVWVLLLNVNKVSEYKNYFKKGE